MTLYSVFLKDLEVNASIGVHDFEKKARQRLFVNVALVVEKTGDGDEIRHVLDYDFLRDGVLALAREGHVNLQETFCERILTICMAREQVMAARVSTEKLDVYEDARAVGCRMAAARDGVDRDEVNRLLNV